MSRARTYALALSSSLKDGKETEVRIARFRQIVKKRGDTRLLGSILRELEVEAELEKGKKAVLVTSSKLSSKLRKEIDELFTNLGWALREEVRAEVIGGAALFLQDSVLIDGTAKKRLQEIFQ
ncbi:MAG: F0F1 ATP synthase subunit delta [bacterium]|nr:F0F1 ATP synthase subunit delta [bacterium]